MIGSHDTFTYLKSTKALYNVAKCWWKTQSQTIEQLYAFGVRMFDIRVRRDHNKWRLCHGIVDLKKTFKSLDEICQFMSRVCPNAIYRIVLERGNSDRFKQEAKGICKRFPNLWRVDIKDSKNWTGAVDNNNQALYDKGYRFALVNTWENPAHELHGTLTVKNFYKTDLKKEAKKINSKLDIFKLKQAPRLTPEQIQQEKLGFYTNRNDLYLIDYCTNKY